MKTSALIIVLTFLFLASGSANCQSKDDRIIIIKVADSSTAHDAIKAALIKNDFVIKDYGSKDTLITYPLELSTMPGYAVFVAVVTGNIIELTGMYSLKKINYLGYSTASKDFIPIRYYRASKSWRALNKVAEDATGDLSFTK